MRTKMTTDGIGEPIGKGSIYRHLEGDEDGILYFKDRKMKLLIRQVMPQDVEIVREARKIEAGKFLAIKRDEFGNKKYVKLSELLKDESDEEILNAIKKANPVNDEKVKPEITIVVFNMRKSRCLCVGDIATIDDDWKVGKIGFTFFKENIKGDLEEQLLKNRVKDILLESGMFFELYEEVLNPTTNQYELKTIA